MLFSWCLQINHEGQLTAHPVKLYILYMPFCDEKSSYWFKMTWMIKREKCQKEKKNLFKTSFSPAKDIQLIEMLMLKQKI